MCYLLSEAQAEEGAQLPQPLAIPPFQCSSPQVVNFQFIHFPLLIEYKFLETLLTILGHYMCKQRVERSQIN